MGTYEGKTAEQWRDQAQESVRRRHDSFERCDTDGFMSQWASGLMAQEYRMKAELAENDGYAEFPALFDLDGWMVPAKLIDTKYGTAWGILEDPTDTNSRVVKWVNRSYASTVERRNASMRRKGYTEGVVRARARVKMIGGDITGVHPVFVRDDGGYSVTAEVVSTQEV